MMHNSPNRGVHYHILENKVNYPAIPIYGTYSTVLQWSLKKMSMISPQKPNKEKNQWQLLININLRDTSILKHPDIIARILSFVQIYLILMEICKEFLMREHKKQPYNICTRLVGRHNYSSPLMY